MSDPTVSDQAAINAALNQDWKEAIRINVALIKSDKHNISLHNRLGFAYLQSGQLTLAKTTFQKVIKLDSYNQIAAKNLKKLGLVKQKDILKNPKRQVQPMSFLEEPGKTKIVECVNTATVQVLSTLTPGEEVELKAKNHTVEIRSSQSIYLGALPDDVSFRLIKFLAVGNTYQGLVKSTNKNTLVIFIRELSRGKRYATQPSFTASAIYVPFTRSERSNNTTDAADPEGKDSDSEE